MKYLRCVLCVLLVLVLCVSSSAFTNEDGEEVSLEITTMDNKNGKVGSPFTWTFYSNAPAEEDVEWLIAEEESDEWPDGLELDHNTGVLSGTPNVEGEYKLNVTVRLSSTTETTDQEFTLTIRASNYGADEGGSGGCTSGAGISGLALVSMMFLAKQKR